MVASDPFLSRADWLASLAGAGEALISEAAYSASGSDLGDLERRELSVKGRDAPLAVRVFRA